MAAARGLRVCDPQIAFRSRLDERSGGIPPAPGARPSHTPLVGLSPGLRRRPTWFLWGYCRPSAVLFTPRSSRKESSALELTNGTIAKHSPSSINAMINTRISKGRNPRILFSTAPMWWSTIDCGYPPRPPVRISIWQKWASRSTDTASGTGNRRLHLRTRQGLIRGPSSACT